MKINRILVASILCITLLLCGCGASDYRTTEYDQQQFNEASDLIFDANVFNQNLKVLYFHDEEREVGIWLFCGYREGGISVLPDIEYLSK